MAQTNFTASDMPGAQVEKPIVAPAPAPEKKSSSSSAKSAKKVEAVAEVAVETVVAEEAPAAETE